MITRQFRVFFGLLVLCLCYVFCMPAQVVVFNVKPANSDIGGSEYSDVMTDLMANGDFNVSDYLKSNSDSAVDVITIAENIDNGLFVYVYEPSYIKDYVFTSINISMVDKSQTKDFKNYKLTLIDRQSYFCKYLVKGLTVGEPHRYEISSIFRGFIDGVDDSAGGGNTVNEISYPIGKVFTFVDGQLKVEDVEYIQITDKYVGFVRYYGGTHVFTLDNCDSHFVAFSTDKQIDRLIEADVYFQSQTFTRSILMGSNSVEPSGDLVENYSYMTDTDEVFYEGVGLWKHSYRWSRIQTVKEFLDGENFENVYRGALVDETAEYKISEDAKKEIENKQWVLRFYESSYSSTAMTTGAIFNYSRVYNVSILRLKFETDGKTYDLGVVDNKQTGSDKPSNEVKIETTISDDLLAILKMILGLVLLCLAAVFLVPLLSPVINFVFWVIGLVFGAIKKIFTMIGKMLKGITRHE